MLEFLQPLIDWYMSNINYYTITLLMAIESSFIPLPSELVVPPAAWKAANGELNIYLVVLFSTVGALLGALFNYYFAKILGRMLVYRFADTRFAHLCLLNRKKVEQAEAYFLKNGNISTFVGRLIPGIRQLISLPAGLVKMKIAPFILYTTLGAAIWNVILAILGYLFYSQKEVLELYFEELTIGLLALGVIFVVYLIVKEIRKRKANH